MKQGNTRGRLIKAAGIGILVGLILLCFVLAPFAISRYRGGLEARMQESNLLPARGEAFAAYGLDTVQISVMVDGKPADSVSVSPDKKRWYMPRDGNLSLELAPGNYLFRGTYGNRVVSVDYTVKTAADNILVLDAAKVPQSPELMMPELSQRKNIIFPLELSGADTVTMESIIDHMRIVRQGEKFSLEVDGSMLSGGFYQVALKAENSWGESKTYVGIRLRREAPVIPVYTAADLDAIRHHLSGSYLLMNDIDLSEIHNWTPISTVKYPFTGVFDGGGHEITGFHSPDSVPEGVNFGIFDSVSHAEIRNVVIRKPYIAPQDIHALSGCAALVVNAKQSLIENCGVIGGTVAPSGGAAAGVVGGAYECILLNLFNSADVFCKLPNKELKNTGGICGGMVGYGACLANEGEVFGTHLTGGIIGYISNGNIFRCINSGYIWGSTMVGEFPVGGIMQSSDGGITADCYFTVGSAPKGGSGFVNSLVPIKNSQLRDVSALPLLGAFNGDAPKWAYASLDANGPIPYSILKNQVEAPDIHWKNGKILLPPVDGLVYFYTLDGSDPRANCPTGISHGELTLPKNGVLTIFAARQGCRDSDILTFTAEGVE